MCDPLIGLRMTKFHQFQFWRYGTLYQGKRGCLGFEKECHGFCWRVKLNLVSSCFNLEKPLRNSRIPESLDCWMSFEEFVERHQKFLGSPPRCVAVPKEQFFAPCFLSWDATIGWKPDVSWTEGMYNMYIIISIPWPSSNIWGPD